MKPQRYIPAILLTLSWVLGSSLPCFAIGLGSNKVRYHREPRWQVLETEHFLIHHAPELSSTAQTAARYAERGFIKISQALDVVPHKKIPLFLYGTGIRFQETNITAGILPEGVGGFTEVFKNRIVVPMGGSFHDLETVITHETVHAFQYNMIYGEGWRSLNLFRAVFVPTWIMEGTAEYIAGHVESQGEMVLRDAVLNDGTIPLNLLSSFDHFEQVYMAYKESASILDYVDQVYGPRKPGELMRKMAGSQNPNQVVKTVLGVSMDELYENWKFFLRTEAWSRVRGRPAPEHYGETVAPGGSKAAVSPDGRRVAFLGNEGIRVLDLAKKKNRLLKKGEFQSQGTGVAWSPDGRYLAAAKRKGGSYRMALIPSPGSDAKPLEFPLRNLPLVYSPAWSPDGRFLVFSAWDFSSTDLYRLEPATGRWERLNQDPATDQWAQFSPDGGFLYYLSEEKGEIRVMKMALDADAKPTTPPQAVPLRIGNNKGIPVKSGHLACLSVGKDSLYLTSDRDQRIFNLYKADPDGSNLTQLTKGYADILNAAPLPDGTAFYAGMYQKTKMDLWRLDTPKFESNRNPSEDLTFLCNHFTGASAVLAGNKPPPETVLPVPGDPSSPDETPRMPRTLSQLSAAENPSSVRATSKTPSAPPALPPSPVKRVSVKEATNIVQLQWPQPENEDESVDLYRVYRATSAAGPFLLLGETVTARRTRFVDYVVEDGQAYWYTVTAANEAGESPPSSAVEARPKFEVVSKPYHFRVSPDILLFLAGYDSSYGFVGGGVLSLSDYLGNHRLSIMGDSIPKSQTGYQVGYQFARYRTTLDISAYYYKDFFSLYDLRTGALVDQYRDNEKGLNVQFTYPLSPSTRVEYGVGTQRFDGRTTHLRFSEGLSNHFYTPSTGEDRSNYYRLSMVRDKRRGYRFWPASGYGCSLTYLQAPSILDSTVSFRNTLAECEWYVDIKPLQHLIWANRLIGLHSEGPNPQTFFLGPDRPFQSFFTTLRGFGNDEYFGQNLALFNVELRYPMATSLNFPLRPFSFILVKDIEVAAFSDTGITADRPEYFKSRKLLNSVGVGLRFYNFVFQRALVQLRFDVAWRTDPGQHDPTFHFNLAPMF